MIEVERRSCIQSWLIEEIKDEISSAISRAGPSSWRFFSPCLRRENVSILEKAEISYWAGRNPQILLSTLETSRTFSGLQRLIKYERVHHTVEGVSLFEAGFGRCMARRWSGCGIVGLFDADEGKDGDEWVHRYGRTFRTGNALTLETYGEHWCTERDRDGVNVMNFYTEIALVTVIFATLCRTPLEHKTRTS